MVVMQAEACSAVNPCADGGTCDESGRCPAPAQGDTIQGSAPGPAPVACVETTNCTVGSTWSKGTCGQGYGHCVNDACGFAHTANGCGEGAVCENVDGDKQCVAAEPDPEEDGVEDHG